MITLPPLELAPPDPADAVMMDGVPTMLDEAVIIVDGHGEDTITVSCEGSRAIAQAIVHLVNAYRQAYPPDEAQAPYDPGPGQVAAP